MTAPDYVTLLLYVLGIFVISTLFSIAGMVPSIGGWGVRETLSTFVFESVSDEKAAAWGVALNLIALAAGLVGGVVYAAEGVLGLRKSQPAQPESSAGE